MFVYSTSPVTRAFRLGNFILMVRKLQILPATVNIEMLAKQL